MPRPHLVVPAERPLRVEANTPNIGAFVHDVDLSLIDDVALRVPLRDALAEYQELVEDVWQHQGFTVVLVTHDVAEAVALADRVIVLDGGTVALEQTIGLARPRRRGSAELALVEGAILAQLTNRGAPRRAARPAIAAAR